MQEREKVDGRCWVSQMFHSVAMSNSSRLISEREREKHETPLWHELWKRAAPPPSLLRPPQPPTLKIVCVFALFMGQSESWHQISFFLPITLHPFEPTRSILSTPQLQNKHHSPYIHTCKLQTSKLVALLLSRQSFYSTSSSSFLFRNKSLAALLKRA